MKCEYSRVDQESLYATHENSPGVVSRLTFGWISDILSIGSERPLQEHDLFSPVGLKTTKEQTDRLSKLWCDEVQRSKDSGTEPRLWKAFLKLPTWSDHILYLTTAFIAFSCVTLKVVFLWLLLASLEWTENKDSGLAYISTFGVVVCSIVQSFANSQNFHRGCVMAAHLKSALVGLIYQKVLSVTDIGPVCISSGHVTNLISKDLDPIQSLCANGFALLTAPFELIAAVLLTWQLIGWQATVGIAYVIVVILYQSGMGQLFHHLRLKTTTVTDQRLELLADVISGIRVVKMCAWEWVFRSFIEDTRSQELWLIIKKSAISAGFRSVGASYVIITTLIALSLLIATGRSLTPKNVFTLMAVWGSSQKTMTTQFCYGVQYASQTLASLHRIQKFLTDDNGRTKECENVKISESKGAVAKLCDYPSEGENVLLQESISLSNDKTNYTGCHVETRSVKRYVKGDLWLSEITCKLNDNTAEPLLINISLDISAKNLTGIIGPVGAGKSSLLHVILGELPISQGQMSIRGTIAYVSQTPWLFSGTIRENILFGRQFDNKKFTEVVSVCSLKSDLESLQRGDYTMIGERGVRLSGGQQSRVSLARAVYADADIYLLDDPLSAVDAKVGREIYQRCICKSLSNRTRILVTHQVRYLRNADYIYVMKNGSITSQGRYEEVRLKDEYLVRVSKDEDLQPVVGDYDESRVTQVLQPAHCTCCDGDDKEFTSKEDRLVGSVSCVTYWSYFSAGLGPFQLALLPLVVLLPDGVSIASSFWLAHWTTAEEVVHQDHYIIVYGVLAGTAMLFTLVRSIFLFKAGIASSKNLHSRMLTAILKSPVRFFDINPCGRILNRFAKDIGGMDDLLPDIMLETIEYCMQVLAVLIVVSVANHWVIISVVPLLAASGYLCRYTLRATRELRRLEAINASPLYSHVAETIRGIITIRSYERQEDFLNTLYSYSDTYNQAFILPRAATRWISVRLDMMAAVLTAVVGLACILSSSDAGEKWPLGKGGGGGQYLVTILTPVLQPQELSEKPNLLDEGDETAISISNNEVDIS